MSVNPKREDFVNKRYGFNSWGKGTPYNPARCAKSVCSSDGWHIYQCSRKAGHGPDELFCKQHAKRYTEKA